jgi:putative GTP pyrophosphokinase
MVKTAGAEQIVSQRLKRIPTILDKLGRHSNMKLTRMQDIGGCRAILPDIATIYRVIARIEKSRQKIRTIFDYIETPKPTGYRAVHVVVERADRLIEVQLRTQRQHAWAAAIERLSGQPGFFRLKDGYGPEAAVEYYKVTSRVIAMQETGAPVDNDLAAEFDIAREEFRRLLEGD